MPLPPYLADAQREIEGYAREYGLDFFHTIFEILDYRRMNEVAAYGGYPTRYPHWRFGMEYEQLSKSHSYGLSKIYEMVINNDPCYAYLLEGNSLVDQKMVMAHVFAHCDFFKNNIFFSHTNRKMIDEMANHATRVRRHIERYGIEPIESFIDVCLSLDNLIDPQLPFRPRTRPTEERPKEETPPNPPKLRAKSYMDRYINPPEFVAQQLEKERAKQEEARRKFPPEPERDVLHFLLQHAPLEHWERDILEMIREEAYYYLPQRQTKVMNEGWACVAPDTLVFTASGLMPMADLCAGASSVVSDGERPRFVYDRHVIRDHTTIRLTTALGFTLTGSSNHRVLLRDGTFCRLDALKPGDMLRISGGAGLFPEHEVEIHWKPLGGPTAEEVARAAGVPLIAVLRYQAGEQVSEAPAIEEAVAAVAEAYALEHEEAPFSPPDNMLPEEHIPATVTVGVGAFLGHLVASGAVVKNGRVRFTTRVPEEALAFGRLARELFGVAVTLRETSRLLVVEIDSSFLASLLVEGLGVVAGQDRTRRRVPQAVLRSPAPVVAAFLRGYADCAGRVGRQGVVLRTWSEKLSEQIQLLLLNFGVLARRRREGRAFLLEILPGTTPTFVEKIGFGLTSHQTAALAYVAQHPASSEPTWEDEVVSLEAGVGDVYDISVADTHRYAAAGLINHNSYWHSKIMTERVCTAADIIEYADHASGVLYTPRGQLNPYKLGIELFRNIEERWNKGQFGREWEECQDLLARQHWDRRLGLGRQKIFEVRRLYNDVTFIDEFFTEDFCRENRFFSYIFNERTGNWEIESREFKKVKERLLFQLTNFGDPFIFVVDGNFENRAELLLKHRHEGVDLKLDHARDTLANLCRVWKRPVNLITKVDGQGKLLRFDGKEHSEKNIDWEAWK